MKRSGAAILVKDIEEYLSRYPGLVLGLAEMMIIQLSYVEIKRGPIQVSIEYTNHPFEKWSKYCFKSQNLTLEVNDFGCRLQVQDTLQGR